MAKRICIFYLIAASLLIYMHKQLAIVGCGRIAERHAENIDRIGRLAAVCDIIIEKADALAEKYNAKAYYSIEQLLQGEKNLDAITICTPNGLHARHSILCLEAGINVLCEKPMCISTKDALTMLKSVKESGKHLFVVKQNRFNPPVITLKKMLNENRLGKIFSFQINCFWNRPPEYYMEWRGTKALDGGTLFTQFSHFIDMLYWLLGDVKHVQAITKNYAHPHIEIEDSGIVLLQLNSGATGSLNYTVNAFDNNMEGSFTIFGEKGTIKIGGQYLNTLEYQSVQDHKILTIEQKSGQNDYGFYKGSMSNHDKVYDHLLKALENETNGMTNAEEAFKTVEIIERIYSAAKNDFLK